MPCKRLVASLTRGLRGTGANAFLRARLQPVQNVPGGRVEAPPSRGPSVSREPTPFYAAFTILTYLRRDEASYRPSGDTVHMPPVYPIAIRGRLPFSALHETVHATAAAARCPPDLSGRFGSEAYALEEIIAEFGSEAQPRPDHAAYVAS